MSIFCRFICCGVLLALSPLLQAMDELLNKENLNPTYPLMRKKESVETQNNDLVLASPKETLRLEGQLSEDTILKLRDPRYNIIYLHCAFFKGKHPAFTEGIINVSPATFNRDILGLSLQVSGIKSANLEGISSFPKLMALYLIGNAIDVAGVKKIALLENLQYLNLSDNRLDNDAVQLISGMPGLLELDISQNRKIDDDGVKHLISHKALRKLNIEHTRVTEEGRNSLLRKELEVKYFPL